MNRERAIKQIGIWVLGSLRLEGGAADKWFRTDEFSLGGAAAGACTLGSEDKVPNWLDDSILKDVERWINTVPFREITEEEVDRARHCGRLIGLEAAVAHVMKIAVEMFQNWQDAAAFDMRRLARDLLKLKEDSE